MNNLLFDMITIFSWVSFHWKYRTCDLATRSKAGSIH